jgi:hypothetical protein
MKNKLFLWYWILMSIPCLVVLGHIHGIRIDSILEEISCMWIISQILLYPIIKIIKSLNTKS